MLTYERLDNREGLTRTRCTDNPCATERIHDVYPSLTKPALVVIPHRDIHAVFVLLQLLTLLK